MQAPTQFGQAHVESARPIENPAGTKLNLIGRLYHSGSRVAIIAPKGDKKKMQRQKFSIVFFFLLGSDIEGLH